jgi:hypothetical protein
MNENNSLFDFNKSLIKLSSQSILNNLRIELDKFLDYLEKQYTTNIDILNNNLLSLLSIGYIGLLKIISLCEIYPIKELNETNKYLFERILHIKVPIKDYLEKINSIKMKNTEIKIKKITEQIKINKEIQQKDNKKKTDTTDNDINTGTSTETTDNNIDIEISVENVLLHKELYKLNEKQFDDSQYEIINTYNNFINHYVFIIIAYKEIISKI